MAKAKRKSKKKVNPADSRGIDDDDKKMRNWAREPDSDVYDKCAKMYPQILKAYQNKDDANTQIEEYWNIYNAIPDDNQVYQGNSKGYIPTVRDSLNARAKRALKQLFPVKYRHVDAISADGHKPYPQLALLEHYIRTTKLKSQCRSMLVAGDVTGQWNMYIDWMQETRDITNMVKRNPIMDTGMPDMTEEEEDLEDEKIILDGPVLVDFATEDLAVIPPTCNDIEKADIVCLKLRMNEAAVQRLVGEGVFVLPDDSEISEWVENKKPKERHNPPKRSVHDAGIKTEGTEKYALIYEATARLELEPGKKSLAYIYFAGEKDIVGIIKAPQWGQKRPILSAPIDRISGSFFGISKVEAVKWLQWNLNDFHNMGQDSAMYSLLPVVMTDPEKNPNYASMVYGLAAVWQTNPQSTQFAEFPPLWKDAVGICETLKNQIKESLDVNDMMMGLMPKGRKNNQLMGMLAQESAVTVVDNAERFEEEILNPLMERLFEYDCQFRDEKLTIPVMGELGAEAALQDIEPQTWGNHWFFQWTGTSHTINMQMMQQQIAMMNVLRGVPPAQLNGRKLDVAPILEKLTSNVFGEELTGQILVDERNKFTIAPEVEDEMMANGIHTDVHPADDDVHHIQVHQEAALRSGDEHALMRVHIQDHAAQLAKKRQMAQAAMQPPKGSPGIPGGARPGVPGTPRPGAQPAGPRPVAQQPAGAIHPDQLMGVGGRG